MLPPKLYAFLCACFAAMGASLFGYDLGVIAYVLVAPDFLRTTGNPDDAYMGFIVSSMLLGAFVASIPASLIADRFSRRTAIVVAGVIFILGGVLQTACQNKETMLAGRFFAGMGIGFLGVLAPLYQSEIAHPSNRGRLTATFQLFIGIGAFIAGWVGYGCQQGLPGSQAEWRVPLALQMAPAVPLVFLTFLFPESPRWLMIKGRNEEALRSLARLHSRGNINDLFVQGEYQEMEAKVQEEAASEGGWSMIFKDKHNLRKVFYGIMLQFSVQMTGVSAIQYYADSVYRSVGFAEDALLINSINNAMGIVGQIICVLFLDKVGRRIPLVGGNIVAGSMFIGATYVARSFEVGTGTRAQGIGFVACIYIYNIFFSACIGPLSWVYPVEIMNTAIRAKATALTSMSAWIANFMIGQVSPTAFNSIGWRYYLVFTVCSFTNALLFFMLFPETKGRTLEEMDQYFRDSYWLVPLSQASKVGSHDRERQLATEADTIPKKEAGHDEYVLGPNESRV